MSIIAAFAVPHPPLIIPEIGKGTEKAIANTIKAYNSISETIKRLAPELIIFITPHNVSYADYFHISPGANASGDFSGFKAGEIALDIEYDEDFSNGMIVSAKQYGLETGAMGEKTPSLDHGVLVPLYFIKKKYSDFKACRVSLSGLDLFDHYRYGKAINELAVRLNRKTVIIASGDLSHKLKHDGPYGYSEEGVVFDELIVDIFRHANFKCLFNFTDDFCESAAECGLRSFVIMAGAFDKMSVASNVLSYEGPFGVGYAVCEFFPQKHDTARDFLNQAITDSMQMAEKNQNNENPYIILARYALYEYLKTKKIPAAPADIPHDLITNKAAVFVSIKKNGTLRGCIGTILPTKNSVAEEIIQNAISAGINDTRFKPVSIAEFPFLTFSVDHLSMPEPIKSASELDVTKYGLIVTSGKKRGVLLPNLDGINTVFYQIAVALQKAEIHEYEDYTMERFEVIRYR